MTSDQLTLAALALATRYESGGFEDASSADRRVLDELSAACKQQTGEPPAAIKSTFVQVILVTDPDTKGEVELEIRKLASGAMLGIDGSYIEQEVGEVYSPYDEERIPIDLDD